MWLAPYSTECVGASAGCSVAAEAPPCWAGDLVTGWIIFPPHNNQTAWLKSANATMFIATMAGFTLEACESPEGRWVWVRVSSRWDISTLRSLGDLKQVKLSDTMNRLEEKEPKWPQTHKSKELWPVLPLREAACWALFSWAHHPQV